MDLSTARQEYNEVRQQQGFNNELEDTLNELTLKNQELKELINYLQNENVLYKKKYNDIKLQLVHLNQLIEQNTRVFQQLYDDSKCALEMGRLATLNSPPVQRKRPISRLRSNSPRPSTSKAISPPRPCVDDNYAKNIARRKLQIEPINIQELQETAADETQEEAQEASPPTLREGLSLIVEESENSTKQKTASGSSIMTNTSNLSKSSSIKELVVYISKLSPDIVNYQLNKMHKRREESYFNTSEDSFAGIKGPNFSSTPLKLETLRSLGLVPTTEISGNFVNVRKRNRGDRNGVANSIRSTSPKKEKAAASPSTANNPTRRTRKRSKSSSKTSLFVNKRRRVGPEIQSDALAASYRQNKENIQTSPEVENSRASPRPETENATGSKAKGRKKRPRQTEKGVSPGVQAGEQRANSDAELPVRQRPPRNGKPHALKEPSLKRKLRRN